MSATTTARAAAARRAAARGRASRAAAAEERYRRYCELRRGGYSIQQAAWELGRSYRQARRYEADRLNQQRVA